MPFLAIGLVVVVGGWIVLRSSETSPQSDSRLGDPAERCPMPDTNDKAIADDLEARSRSIHGPAVSEDIRKDSRKHPDLPPALPMNVDVTLLVPIPTAYKGEKVWLIPIRYRASQFFGNVMSQYVWQQTDYAIVKCGVSRGYLSGEETLAIFGESITAESPDGETTEVAVVLPSRVVQRPELWTPPSGTRGTSPTGESWVAP